MSFWKPLIDWNASHKYHGANRSEAKWGIGIGIWRPNGIGAGAKGNQPEETAPVSLAPVALPPGSLPRVAPGDIHGAF